MFSLENQKVKIANVNPRRELHGDENVAACDIKIEMRCSNEMLIEFSPTLRQHLYKESDQPSLLDGDDDNKLTALRYPEMSGGIKWEKEMAGYELTIHYGIGGKSDICLDDCKVNNFVLHPQEGGTVILSLRIQTNPRESAMGKLCMLIQEEMEISLLPPGEKQLDIDAAAVRGNSRRGRQESAGAAATH